MILALFGIAIAAQREQSPTVEAPECADKETVDRIRELTLQGLDMALRQRTEALFEVWMKDDAGQPERARRGIGQGIRAYLHGREQALAWSMPVCKK
jgi:hypothetical protein